MARIPEAEIERLKVEISVERLVGSAGIESRKSGKDRTGRCPFHEDDTASLAVTPAKNLWHCFGRGVGGAYAGHKVQQHYAQPVQGQQIVVRTSNGVLVTVTQPVNPALAVGQNVRIEGSGEDARVVAR